MNLRALAMATVLLLAACSKVTQENFAKIQSGMTEQEVLRLLGEPTDSTNVQLLGVSGTSSRWVADETVITVRFVNGQVAMKNFSRTAAKK